MLEGEEKKGRKREFIAKSNSAAQAMKHQKTKISLPTYRQCDNPN